MVEGCARMSKCVGPQMSSDRAGPSSVSVYQHGSGELGQIANSLLRSGILEMSVDAAKRESLTFFSYRFAKLVVSKYAVVGMVVEYLYPVRFGQQLEGFLRFDCLIGVGARLEMHIAKTTVVVDEDSCTFVPFQCRSASQLCNQAGRW